MIPTEKRAGDRLVVYLAGRLDFASSATVEKHLFRLIEEQGERHLVLNLAGVEYITSSGFQVCISVQNRLKRLNGSLRLASPRPSIKRVFNAVELTPLFQIYETEEKALEM